jgi:hypothetical protein
MYVRPRGDPLPIEIWENIVPGPLAAVLRAVNRSSDWKRCTCIVNKTRYQFT